MASLSDRYKGKRVLVTGGAGFIGSELVRILADGGARVAAVDNLVNGKRENLDGDRSGEVELAVCDIRDEESMKRQLAGEPIVVHLACLGVRHSLHSPVENHEVNATAALRLLELCRQAGVERFVHVSTSEVYGNARFAPMNEDHPLQPNTVYGADKLAGEAYARAFHLTHRFPAVIIRPFNTFGPRCHHEGDSGEVIPLFILRALSGEPLTIYGSGRQTRDFSFVGDIARGIALAGVADNAVGSTINLGSGEEISIANLAETILDLTESKSPIEHAEARPGDTKRLVADISQARSILDYDPRTTLQDGLRILIDWYKNHPRSLTELSSEMRARNWERALT